MIFATNASMAESKRNEWKVLPEKVMTPGSRDEEEFRTTRNGMNASIREGTEFERLSEEES